MRALTLVALLAMTPMAGASPIFLERFTTFDGRGLAPSSGGPHLDSRRWRIGGLSDGTSAFGDTRSSGDFARGRAAGAVSSGGIYAFVVGALGQRALGLQPTGSDLTPGFVELRLALGAASVADAIAIDYSLAVLNDQPRSTRVAFGWRDSGTLASTGDTALVTASGADAAPGWTPSLHHLVIHPARGSETLTLRWDFDDAGGRGGRDQVAISEVRVGALAGAGTAATVGEPRSAGLAMLGLSALLWRRKRRINRSR